MKGGITQVAGVDQLKMPIMTLIIVLLLVAQFNSFRRPLVTIGGELDLGGDREHLGRNDASYGMVTRSGSSSAPPPPSRVFPPPMLRTTGLM